MRSQPFNKSVFFTDDIQMSSKSIGSYLII
nr:MAG TPA: hypothetical protein [Caudoviricetes sp.]